MQAARDLLLTARSQQRHLMEQAKVAAKGSCRPDQVEYVGMFAKVAHVQDLLPQAESLQYRARPSPSLRLMA
jgi:hypothetical protein